MKRWLVWQFFSSHSHARPAREPVEAVTVAVFGFGVVALCVECVECAVVGCVFDSRHVFTEGVPVDVMRARAGHQFVSHVDGESVLVGCRVLVALVGDFDESGGIDVEEKLFGLCAFLCRLVILWDSWWLAAILLLKLCRMK